jgi:phosphoglucosamine mutase
VAETKADIGIAFDGDGDRVIMVDKNGFLYDGDRILAIAADYLKRQERLSQNTVVGTVMSNLGLERFIHSLDCQFIRTPVGDRYILKELLDGGYNLGGEQSGHIIFSDYSRSGDGIISALFVLKVLMHENKELSDYRNIIDDYPQIILNVPVKKKVDLSDNSAISEIIESVTTKLGNAGRVLVRNSGTELKTRIMIEGDDEILIKSYANDIAEVVTRELG